MPSDAIAYFDIAAVVIMLISLASLILRNLTRGAANRVYLTCMALVTVTALAAVGAETCDALITPAFIQIYPISTGIPQTVRDLLAVLYYALRSLSAPAYLVLIATVSDTTHRLNNNNVARFLLWVPMIATFLLIASNPAHHLVLFQEDGLTRRGPLFTVLYIEAIYYSLIGIFWLIRWRELLNREEFSTLMLLYPIMLAAVAIQAEVPGLRLEMFVTSIALMLVSAFVIRVDTRQDAMMNAASLHAYNEMCHRAFITEKPLCLVYIEIVNMERLRELVGKVELQEITRRIANNLNRWLEHDDTLYYLRNGLFCISPRNTNPEHALEIATRAHEEGMARSLAVHEKAAATAMRTCIVRVPEDATDRETIRNFGRRLSHLVPHSTVTTFQDLAKNEDFKLQMALSDIIERATKNRSFEIHYQPIYCLKDGRYHSAEALVRLNDPEFGWISPTLFIPEAEANGSILDIGDILLEKICAFLGEIDYEKSGLSYVEANLSVEQCVRPELAGEVLGLLEKYGVEPSRLNIEITETSASYSQQAIEDNVRALAAAGVTLSLDDYGTGYSSASRMLSLPFSLVKIDKFFVDGLDDTAKRTVLSNMVASVKAIGKDVLVEGVETREQAEILAEMGVDYIQGYYYAKPISQDEFAAFLQKQER